MSESVIAVWFSCGAASAVAAKKTVEKYGKTHTVRVINNPVAEEDDDNIRFKDDVEAWIGVPIETAINRNYPSCSAFDVWEKRQYMAGPQGAPCTGELKKKARQQWERENHADYHVLGFTADKKEVKRHSNFTLTERDNVIPVLIDEGLTKGDCFRIIQQAGIDLPRIYHRGYPNANCFTGETRFLTRKGIVSFNEVVGETVEVRTGEKGNPWREAYVESFGVQPIVEIHLKRGQKKKVIRTTENHRWFRGSENEVSEVETKDLSLDDKLVTQDAHPWVVEEIRYTSEAEQVFCVKEPVSKTFTLEDNILTGNCIGCVKSSSPTYWNLVREQDPEVFKQRAEQSRRIGAKLVRYKGQRMFLDELPEDAKGGPLKTLDVECGSFCEER